MKRFLLLFIFSLLGYHFSVGQQQSGAQTLRLARSVYEQGRLHEIPVLLNDKNIPSFSKAEKVDAYRLLALSYVYLEEPEKADEAMRNLLDTDHFYEPNVNVEPAEFMGLYKTFRTRPVFGIGLKFGGNFTFPFLSSQYYVASAAPNNGKYAPNFGIQVGIVYEKEIFSKAKSPFLRRVLFTPEVLYTNRTFSYTNNNLFTLDNPSDPTNSPSVYAVTAKLKQTYIDINPVFQLRQKRATTLNPYYGFGPGISYLLSAANTMQGTRISASDGINSTGSGAIVGPDVPTTSAYAKIVPSLIASAGIKYRFGSIYLMGEVRAQYGLMNPVNPSKRTVSSSVFDYNFTPPDYKPLNLTINIGFVFPYFNPVKLNSQGGKIKNTKKPSK